MTITRYNFVEIPRADMSQNNWATITISDYVTLPNNANGVWLHVWNTSSATRTFGVRSVDNTQPDRERSTRGRAQMNPFTAMGGANSDQIEIYVSDISGTGFFVYIVAVTTSDETLVDHNPSSFITPVTGWNVLLNADPGNKWPGQTPIGSIVEFDSPDFGPTIGWQAGGSSDNDFEKMHRKIWGGTQTNGSSEIDLYNGDPANVTVYAHGIMIADYDGPGLNALQFQPTTDNTEETITTMPDTARLMNAHIQSAPGADDEEYSARAVNQVFPADPSWPTDFGAQWDIGAPNTCCDDSGDVLARVNDVSAMSPFMIRGWYTEGVAPPVFNPAWAMAGGRRVVQ